VADFGGLQDHRLRDERFYLILTASVSLVGGVVIAWRYFNLRRMFQVGQEARGKVLKSSFYRDRGRVIVEYAVKGEKEKLRAVNHLHTTRRTKAIKDGDWVTVLVDPEKPKKIVVKNAYLDVL
jgi:hypothetical protein